jgi:general secretion pathway protein F
MARFRYQAYTSAGEIEAGAIDAPSASDAARLLVDRGLLPFQTEPAFSDAPRASWIGQRFGRRISLAELAHFARELSVLLGAGLPLDQALRVMVEQASLPHLSRLLRDVLDGVTAGLSLSTAFEQHVGSAPAYVANLVRAGEARGNLAVTLADLASFMKKRADVEARVRSAFTYPLILAATAFAVVLVIVLFLIPALLPLFAETGAEPPLTLVLAQNLQAFISTFWPVLMVGLVLVGLLLRNLLRREAVRVVLDRFILRLPLIGRVTAKTNVALLARTLGTLVRNGVGLVPALTMTAAAVPSRSFAAALRTAADGVREGRRLAATLDATPPIPKLMVRFVALGEEASKLDDMLLHLADMTDGDAQTEIDKLMTLLTPALTIAIGVAIGSVMMSVMHAILSVNQLALQ